MAVITVIYLPIFLLPLLIFFFRYWLKNHRQKTLEPINWPLIGMIFDALHHARERSLHGYIADGLKEFSGTFLFKGPCFPGIDVLLTADPANMHHITIKNFSNYERGPFSKFSDILGDGILNSDSEMWRFQRKTTMAIMKEPRFQDLMKRVTWLTVEDRLIPKIESVCENAEVVDLQKIFQEFGFYSTCSLILDYEPKNDISHEWSKAVHDIDEGGIYRTALPEGLWKLQRMLQIGKEKGISEAWMIFDRLLYKCISLMKESYQDQDSFSVIKSCAEACQNSGFGSDNPDKFLRDTLLSLILAGKDTISVALTWFFYLIATHPSIELKIHEEIAKYKKENETLDFKKLVYLHASLSESLRLYPPVAFNPRVAIEQDTLPSGHKIKSGTKVILSFYSMGRMETIWGNDCLEFKPERWISENGGFKQQTPSKFPVFNAGPKTCLGMDMSFMQMKSVATTIICNYNVELVKGHPIIPTDTFLIAVKDGLRVRISRKKSV